MGYFLQKEWDQETVPIVRNCIFSFNPKHAKTLCRRLGSRVLRVDSLAGGRRFESGQVSKNIEKFDVFEKCLKSYKTCMKCVCAVRKGVLGCV